MKDLEKFSDDVPTTGWIKSLGFILFLLVLLFFFMMIKPVLADVVNINKANSVALQQNLSGIGPLKAEAIIKYREKNGAFKSIDDLAKVPGIGKETLRKNKGNLSTSRGVTKAIAGKAKSLDKKDAKEKVAEKAAKTSKKADTDKKTMQDKVNDKAEKGKKSVKAKKAKADKKSLESKAKNKAKKDKKSIKEQKVSKSKKLKADKKALKDKTSKKLKKIKIDKN